MVRRAYGVRVCDDDDRAPLLRSGRGGGVRVCQVVAKSGALARRCAPPSPAAQERGWGASQMRAPPSPAAQERGWLSAIHQASKLVGLVLLRQALDQRVERAFEHVGQVVQRQALPPVAGVQNGGAS